MITYTVHEPPNAPADRLDRAETLVFVKEGFTWPAAAFGPFWLGLHRLWIPLILYLALIALLQAGAWALGIGARPASYVSIGLSLLLGLEASTIRRWALDLKGWRMLGAVNGRNAEDCERRFFEKWLPGQPYVRREALTESGLARRSDESPLATAAAQPMAVPAAPAPVPGSGWRSAIGFGRKGS